MGRGVHRRRGSSAGKIGTTLRFTDREGRRTTVAPDGTSEYSLTVREFSENGRPLRASGSLKALRALRRNQPDPANVLLVELISPGVTILVGVGITDQCLPGYFKTALHFAAGFVDAPHAATIAALRPYIFEGRAVPIVPLPFRDPFFDPEGPVRHEVTIYPDGKNAVVTIMLFSAIIVAIELPHFGTRRSLRYRQMLGQGSGHRR
jgi:hypothetical protein